MFKADTLLTDISAGVTVGCIAIPLSLVIAIASGVPAEVGLVTASLSGVFGSIMGGTTLAVTGPAAAISLLVVGAVQQHGWVLKSATPPQWWQTRSGRPSRWSTGTFGIRVTGEDWWRWTRRSSRRRTRHVRVPVHCSPAAYAELAAPGAAARV